MPLTAEITRAADSESEGIEMPAVPTSVSVGGASGEAAVGAGTPATSQPAIE